MSRFAERPISPHLGIYRPQISSVLSILHRFAGIALYAGLLPLTFWLWSAAYSAECYRHMQAFMRGPVGVVMLVGWSFSFYYHLINGIRHLFWDAGKGFSLSELHRTGWTAVIFALAMTGFTAWWALCPVGGMR